MSGASIRYCEPSNDLDPLDVTAFHSQAARDQIERYLCRRLSPHVAASVVEDALQHAGLDRFPAYDPERERFVRSDLRSALVKRAGVGVAESLGLERWGSRQSLPAPPAGVRRARSSRPPRRAGSVPPDDRRSWLAGAPAAPEEWIGTVLHERYRIVEKRADGFRGELFRAERVDGVSAAIKLLRPLSFQERAVFETRLQDEVDTARRLRHRNTLRVFEHGLTDEGMFVAAEWLDGSDLAEYLRAHGRLSVHRALFLASQVCSSLAEAHALGVVHGDLSPQSIFLEKVQGKRRVKVMDYGRRRLANWADDGQSQVELPAGWARYQAPEQITGEEFDARADIYALGAILYQALSGCLPFPDGTAIGILMAQVYEKPAPLVDKAPDVPPAVAALVMRCLEKDPASRVDSAAALISDIDGLLRR